MDPLLPAEMLAGWQAAAAAAATLPTQDAPWTIASLVAFPGRSNVIAVGDSAQPQAVAPLVQRGPLLELPGCSTTGEPVDFFADSPDSLAALAEEVAATRRPLVLERLPAESPTIGAMREALGQASVRLSEKVEFPTITLEERWAEPGGGLSSSRRSALRRGRRKAEKHGEVTIELLSPSPAEVDLLLDEAFAVETRSWKGVEGTAVAFVPQMNCFYRRYARELAERGQFRLDFMRVEGRAVAMQYGAVWKGSHWLFKIGYDAAFRSSSPGQVLLGESVAAATQAGLRSYELLGGRADWTDAWTEDVTKCMRAVILPHTPRGALGAGALRGRSLSYRAGGAAKARRKQLIRTAEAAYVCGTELGDALAELERCVDAGYETTVGFWPAVDDSPERVVEELFAAAEQLPAGSELSIKLDAIGTNPEQLDALLEATTARDLSLHIDAIGAGAAGRYLEVARRLGENAPDRVGCTLPGRWARSAADAAQVAASGLRVRVVKGEFEDPAGELDPTAGSLTVVEALAGSDCHVEIATQDAELARPALDRLLAAGTSCELQILYAMQAKAVIKVARELGVPIRIYLPYGAGRLPYGRDRLRSDPVLLAKVVRDALPLPPRRPPRINRASRQPAT
jgi:CelD/BcsL family acetyltransferase involved in cellulose biosynthesis